jgi:hypothetical protein
MAIMDNFVKFNQVNNEGIYFLFSNLRDLLCLLDKF